MCPPAPDPLADIILNVIDAQALMYLDRFIRGSPLPENVLEDINPYEYNPSNLPDGFWYLVHSTEKKENEFGHWEIKEQASEVLSDSFLRGWKTTLEFVESQDSVKRRTNWVMQEYKIKQKGLCSTNKEKEPRSICRISLSAARSSNPAMQPKSKSAIVIGNNDARRVPSISPGIDRDSTQASSSRSLMKCGDDGTQLFSDDGKHLNPRIRDLSELDHMLNGDYLELYDLADPESCSSSSANSSRSSMTFDEYFDPIALLKELEDTNSIAQTKDSSSRFRVTAPARPFEVVMQPATSGSLVCATGREALQTGCSLTSSDVKTVFLDQSISDHNVKKLKAEQREKGPLCSDSVVVSPKTNTPSPKGEKKASDVKAKRLKKYFCFMTL